MENLKVKVNSEAESKEAQELFFELGVSWFEGKYLNENIPCDRSIILHNFGSQLFWSHIYENKNFGDAKEITLPELRSMVFVDEPFFTPECTLNDQYAEIEQVRQNQKTIDAMHEAEGILSDKQLKGMKYDNDKPRHSLLPKGTVNAVINVLEFGAKKYEADNWKKVDNAKERYYNAAMRHIDRWWNGEKRDPETNIHHLAHAATSLFFLIWFDENGEQ